MIRRRLWTSLIGIVVVAVALLVVNVATGHTPVLGLDLRGGVSVILRPDGDASADDLLVIRDLVRDELEARGIAEPDVRVEGSNIVVDLPGVKDQQDALDAVDVAGIVSFRPVTTCGLGSTEGTSSSTSTTTATGSTSATGVSDTTASTTAGSAATVAASSASSPTTPVTAAGFGAGRLPAQTIPPTTTTSVPATDGPASSAPPGTGPTGSSTPGALDGAATTTTTAATPDTSALEGQQILRTLTGDSCLVGPAAGGGEIFQRNSASVEFGDRGWAVSAELTGSGETAWNAVAAACFTRAADCPSQQLAIVLDDVIQSAPVVQTPNFDQGVSITGMDESEARSLARVIDRGAFPVQVEPATVQTVSPTLGQDSLRASIFAGILGVLLVLVMLIVFYRYLTVLVLAGMAVWGLLIYSISAFISETTNYALTLAGVTGIIVSIGMTVDSYVIYFERLKDEARRGRTLRNSAARAFQATWKTILAANLVSAIGAAVLFVLSVGSVRGFALYLGVTTVCDVLVLWFFTRPAVILFAGTGWLDRHNTFGLDVPRRALVEPGPEADGLEASP